MRGCLVLSVLSAVSLALPICAEAKGNKTKVEVPKESTTHANVNQVTGNVFVSAPAAPAATARGPRRVRPKPIEH
jgi:hypothetical protein